ncbi:hypothetical protein EHQ68_13840 [Leptospira congkakensis]|uniref:Uncharacterized protein n=1 Tax=Leptospira congkakensis TaxID=2484932 RepID=A0A4Z0ZYZ3_9LEPT|nr:hypothetical protein [Leptospira congkakensis]TGL86399.1 hypothetical protein EHQ68_13840 [Leptospira congkakensis]TGL94055.1 hypothetical protein EHQ69_06190 [Leptospira congkakensis]TGL94539.1 hypothetical protein EHQ70_14605 [Leptospira congkakensis]
MNQIDSKRGIVLFLSLISLVTNCMIGTQEQSCMYYLERDYGNACLWLVIGYQYGEPEAPLRSVGINYSLVNCYTYLKKKKDCERNENKYLPGLYGIDVFNIRQKYQMEIWSFEIINSNLYI